MAQRRTQIFWSPEYKQNCVFEDVPGLGWQIRHVGVPVAPRNPFHVAAVNVRSRYYRRHPQVDATRFDLTTIKSRWYERGRSETARTRFA